jgi:hypothetical protein
LSSTSGVAAGVCSTGLSFSGGRKENAVSRYTLLLVLLVALSLAAIAGNIVWGE